jgi:PAS domain S-box-containing protein
MATNQTGHNPQARAQGHPVPNQNNTCVPRFDEAIATAQQRLATLQEQAAGAPQDQKHILSEACQELQITLEDLQIADEELRQQNEELVMARQVAEVERQRYQALFDFAPDAYLVTDAAALIQEANQAAAALLGVPKHRLRGKPLVLFIEPTEQRAFCDHLTYLSRRGEVQTWEMRLQPRRGVPLCVAVTTRVSRDAQGQPLGLRWLLHDISERKTAQERAQQAEQALQQSREQLRALATHLQDQQEEERRRIAREIHDELGQALTALKIDLVWLSNQWATADLRCRNRLTEMGVLLDGLVSSVRRIGTELRPGILDDLGLTAAIEWQLQEVHKRTGLSYKLTLPEDDIALDQARATGMFRIFQEALTNVLRHASAGEVTVRLVPLPNTLVLEVADDGKGITSGQLADRSSLGLLSMRERAHLLGGDVTILGKAGEGTIVSLRVPYGEQPGARGFG